MWEAVLRLLTSKRLDPTPILAETWDLSDWRDAFEAMYDGEIVKAQLNPQELN